MRKKLKSKKRIVLKVGSSVLTNDQGMPKSSQFRALASEVAWLGEQNKKVVVVSSGAIAAGMHRLGHARKPHLIGQLQAMAAAGQTALMHEYEKAFAKHGLLAAQILLTQDDLSNRRRYLNARHTLYEILRFKMIPVINENDSVAVHEIKVGDNDNLSALVANVVEADLLILLTDIDGVFEEDPRLKKNARRLSVVENIGPSLKKKATGTLRPGSTGGMLTKLEAAEKAIRHGVSTVIANGKTKDIVKKILAGEDVGTLILPHEGKERLSSKKHWLAYGLRAQGRISVDSGAREALVHRGKSLLPSGVQAMKGSFSKGDPIDICVGDAKPFARGLASCSSFELQKIMGHSTKEIENILGYSSFEEVVHRNDMVIL